MINCYLLDGKFKNITLSDFKHLAEVVDSKRKLLHDIKLDCLINILALLGKRIINDSSINSLAGVSYIALWLRKDNLKKICELNFQGTTFHENFEESAFDFKISAKPRGIVCQWIAANMPTLAFFSLIQSILSKNASVINIPAANKDIILAILKNLSEIKLNYEGSLVSGEDIVKSIALVSFSRDYEVSKMFSLIADVKIVWGSAEAVKVISALPQKEHCEVIALGPKYSFGVFDRAFIESNLFDNALKDTTVDISLFNQMACSSPHVIFFERSRLSIIEIAQRMKKHFENLPDKLRNQYIPEGLASGIINTRGIYLLDEGKNIIKSDDIAWTILINDEINLEEPVQGKTIFIKEIDSTDQIIPLVTRKIQAISVSILDANKKEDFANKATYNGVDRITIPGKIHNFSLPWDGILILNRLVRWVILNN